jgi:hypothetical protein
MVETPSAAITVSAAHTEEGSQSDKEALLETGPTITLVHQKPITSSIRGTFRHLVSLAGGWSRVRGFGFFYFYNIVFGLTHGLITAILPGFPGSSLIVTTATGALLANLHAAWTHKVISMPTSVGIFKRIPARSEWKVLAPAAAAQAIMPYISIYIIQASAILMGLHQMNVENSTAAKWACLIVKLITMLAIIFACTMFLCLPAMVTQIRVEASLLPEEHDTIVPFDRTFSGKVVAKILGGTGSVGFLDAWRSFNWEARTRLIKVYVKAFFIVVGIFVIVFQAIALEAWLIAGPSLSRAVAQAGQS